MRLPALRLVLSALLLVAAVLPASASADRTFSKRFGVNDTGDIAIAGNTLMTCPSHCQAETGTGPNLNNNDNDMVRVDVDSDATTIDSSTATLDLPAGAAVLYAGLYWSADTSAGTNGAAADASKRGKVKLAVPGASAYATLTSTQTDQSSTSATRFQGFVDVTTQVAAAGAGVYRVADVQAGTGQDRYAGWSIVVAYHDDAALPRNLTVFDGLVAVSSGSPTAQIDVSGFTTAPTGPVTTTLGAVSYEGDLGLTGDGMDLDGHAISDAQNAADNIFNSSVSRRGTRVTGGRNPDQVNHFGFDADQFDADGLLGNSATTASLHLTTGGETYYPGVLTFSSELLAPKVRTTTVVNDLNGGDVEPGDVLEYVVSGQNTGNDTASDLELTTAVDAEFSYVPHTLEITAGAGAGTQTDAAGDDRATYDATGSSVLWKLGAGATPATGGTLAPGASFSARFRVTVGAPADGASAGAPGVTTYTGAGTGDAYSITGTGGSVTVHGPDLSMDVAHTGTLVRGATADWTLTVANTAGSTGTHGAATVVDDLPTGLTLASAPHGTGWDCTATTGTHVSCTRADALAHGDAWPAITVPVAVGEPAPASVDHTATISGGGDGITTNNGDTDTAAVVSRADLSVTLTRTPAAIRSGATTTFTATMTNAGPSNAAGAVLAFALPAGLHLESATVGGVSCGATSCALGTVAARSAKQAVLTVRADAGPGTQTVSASGSATTTDTSSGNDADSAGVDLLGPADLDVTTGHGHTAPAAGTIATFTTTVHNAGPAAATGVTVTLTLPAGLAAVAVTVPGGSCTVGAGVATCTIDRIADGDTVAVTVTGKVPADAAGKTYTLGATAQADQADPDASNDRDDDHVTAVAIADLGVSATAPATAIAAGDDAEFTLQVHNSGPSDATQVVVTQLLPDGAEVVDLDPRCAQDGRAITCSVPSILVDASAPITFHVHAVRPIAAGLLGAGASVKAAGQDPNTTNDALPAAAAREAAATPEATAAVPRTCLSRRLFTIRLRLPHQRELRHVAVTVDGKPVAVRHARRLTARIDLRGRYKSPRVVVRITATITGGRRIVGTRTYKTCDLKLPRHRAPNI